MSPPPRSSIGEIVVERDALCASIIRSSLGSRVTLLFGSRQAGKTAVLRHIVKTVQPSSADVDVLGDFDLPVFVDLMRLPYDATPPDFFRLVLEAAHNACSKAIRGFAIPQSTQQEKLAGASPEAFASSIQLFRQGAGEVNLRFVFLLDEARRVLGPRFPRGFQDNLYALLFNPDLGVSDHLSFVFSGAQHLNQFFDDDTSPLGSRAESHIVVNLTAQGVQTLCARVFPLASGATLQSFGDWLYGLTTGQAGLTSMAVRLAAEHPTLDDALARRENIADELEGRAGALVNNWASSLTNEARAVVSEFGSRASITPKEIGRILSSHKLDAFATDRVVDELQYSGALVKQGGRLMKGNAFLWEYMERFGKDVRGSQEEREAWNLIEELELTLRDLISRVYEQNWPGGALDQMRANLGNDEWKKIVDLQSRSTGKYRFSPDYAGRDEMSCMYLGQLMTLMLHRTAWNLFKGLFRDQRHLQDLMAAITPVRADRAHFTSVPAKEVLRCKIACDDLLVITQGR